MNSKILSIAHFLPEDVLTNDMLEHMVDTNDEWIVKRTGIKTRHINNNLQTAEMGAISAKKALEKIDFLPENIDVIIGATITPDHKTPSMACVISDLIGATNAYCFDIAAACSGMIYAIDTADALIKSGKAENVLVVCAESLSRIIDYTDRNTCVLFGDGACSLLVSKSDEVGIENTFLASDGTGAKNLYADNLPVENFLEKSSDRYFLHMNGAEILRFTTRVVPKAIDEVLLKANISIDDIDFLIPHQANIRVIQSIIKKYNFDYNKIGVNLDRVGNTSSASVGICMSELVEQGKIKRGDKLLLVGFGAGLTYGAIILEY